MDVSKAGALVFPGEPLIPAPARPADNAPGGGGFAAVLARGTTISAEAPAGSQRCPVLTTPILEFEPVTRGRRVTVERAVADRPVPPVRASIEVLGERGGRPGPVEPKTAEGAGGSWQRLLEDTVSAEGRIDAMIEAARGGRAFSAGQLIGLQMEVFRYSQTVEIISRSTDKIIGAFKQTLGTQV